jgi:ribosomal protein L37AE/L43A
MRPPIKKNPKTLCPICKKGHLRRLEYDLCYCDTCGEEFALNDTRGMLWYKRKNRRSYERDYVVIKKMTSSEISHLKSSLS